MKLLILHLSDMHFRDSNNYDDHNLNAIKNALRPSISDINHVLIIVSGDLTFSGKKTQFIDVRKFLNRLKSSITQVYHINDIQFAIVPGNHDVDYSNGTLTREDLEKIDEENSYDSRIEVEYTKQKQFYFCARLFDCFPNESLIHQKELAYGDKTILLNLINTAVFSSLGEDQGFHFISDSDIEMLNNQGDADYIFTIMHHPHSWFNWRITDQFESAIYSKSDLVFVGHKHYETTRTVIDSQISVNILAGGMLSNCGFWDNSELHIGVLDLEDRQFSTKNYQWSKSGSVYIEKETLAKTLSKDRFDSLGMTVRKEFLNELNTDPFLLADSVLDYFVFPLLEEQREERREGTATDIYNIEAFLKKLDDSNKVIVSGLKDSGKTVLTKAVFSALSSKKTVLLINGLDVTSNIERTIKNTFEDIYGHDTDKYEHFRQASPDNLAIIIDDIDAIDGTVRDKFMDYINEHFGIILETCQMDIELDIENRLKQIHDRKDYTVYRLEPFYSNKRKELVSNIVNIIGTEGQNKESIINILCDSLAKQKSLYNWSPSFIVQFTNYFYNNIGESSQKDGDVFSTVFANNLTSMIRPFIHKSINLEKALIILDKIAYEIYKNKAYPITTTRVSEIIDNYNEKYDSTVDAVKFLSMLVNARIVKQSDGGYVFYERSYLAFFTAREIRRLIYNGDFSDLKHVMEYSYMNINADILLFVTFITDNVNIIRMLMDMAEIAISQWKEFTLSPVNVGYLTGPTNLIVKPVVEGDREKEEQNHIETERQEVKSFSVANDASIFEGESEELSFIQEILRSTSIMTTLARALPSFEHLMEKEDKDRCVELLYTMPLRIFYVWACEVDEVSSELVQKIKEFHEWQYRKDKPEVEPLTDQNALTILRWESTSVLLELMNAPFSYATKESTWKFIDRFEYNTDSTYGIEHLMGVGHRDLDDIFTSEAIKLFNDNKEPQTRLMVQRVARNYIVTSRRIQRGEVQRLNNKLFSNKLKPSHLLMEQGKNRKKV